MCHIENVVRSKASKILSFQHYVYICGKHFWVIGEGTEIKKVYNICFIPHAHYITIFYCIFEEKHVNSHNTQGPCGVCGVKIRLFSF